MQPYLLDELPCTKSVLFASLSGTFPERATYILTTSVLTAETARPAHLRRSIIMGGELIGLEQSLWGWASLSACYIRTIEYVNCAAKSVLLPLPAASACLWNRSFRRRGVLAVRV